ncbi:MAG: 3-deoxy-D-manno-octulosonic acid transferase [Flavobacteriales bacterium]
MEEFRRRETRPVIWFHCASYGEFEQGRPVLESIRRDYPNHALFLTFFSPSGYEAFKDKPVADGVGYMLLDTPSKAKFWFQQLQPVCWVLVKYDLWANHLLEAKRRGVPVLVFSSHLREHQHYFGWMKPLWERAFQAIHTWHVQTEASKQLLESMIPHRVIVSGDTRADRVLTIADRTSEDLLPADHTRCRVVAGSTWPDDEAILRHFRENAAEAVQWIIVPHEVSESRIRMLLRMFPGSVRWSQCSEGASGWDNEVIIVDAMGLLSRLYRHADIAYVGGGFGAGIHNTLEPAAHGKPVLFGPRFQKFTEAKALIDAGAAFGGDAQRMQRVWTSWLSHRDVREEAGRRARAYVQSMSGATEQVMRSLQEMLR